MNPEIESIEANKGYTFEEQFKQLYELSDNPKRKEFLDDLFQFMADRNQPVNRIPIMAKQVLDLYELYNLVVERGGLVEVINKKIWREITKGLNLPSSITSAAFTLRTQYMKYLYPYECAKRNFSRQEELQQAIDGNRREGRRSGAAGLANYNYLIGEGGINPMAGAGGVRGETYSSSPSPNNLFASNNGGGPANHHQTHVSSQQQQQQQQQQLLNHHLMAAVMAAEQRAQLANNSNLVASPSDNTHQNQHHQQQQQHYQGKWTFVCYRLAPHPPVCCAANVAPALWALHRPIASASAEPRFG